MNCHVLRSRHIALASLVLALSWGCHGGGGRSLEAPLPQPSFELVTSPFVLSVPAGGGGYSPVTVYRSGGFTGPVTLTLEGGPPGVVGSGLVASGELTGSLSILIAPEVAPQSLSSLRVKGSAGTLERMATLRLQVLTVLPPGRIPSDQVQASGALQRGGTVENTAIAGESVGAATSRAASGDLEVRHGFKPSGSPL